MSRKINITKYRGNTCYSVHIIDSYGTEHHLGYYNELPHTVLSEIEADAEMLWENEVEPKEDLMANAIANMIELERKSGLHFTDNRGNHRDGLD